VGQRYLILQRGNPPPERCAQLRREPRAAPVIRRVLEDIAHVLGVEDEAAAERATANVNDVAVPPPEPDERAARVAEEAPHVRDAPGPGRERHLSRAKILDLCGCDSATGSSSHTGRQALRRSRLNPILPEGFETSVHGAARYSWDESAKEVAALDRLCACWEFLGPFGR
jgi:hypothetical protein